MFTEYDEEFVTWKEAWSSKTFRSKTIIGLVILISLLCALPYFFQYIQTRGGAQQLNDWLLNWLTPHNLSIPIFTIIWGMSLLIIYRSIQDPQIFILMLWGFMLLTLSRIATITFVNLEAPENLIELKDPLTNTFYGGKFITRDLFYSGHTATQFLIFLCLRKKVDKALALISTILVGVMVLIQHVHYTIDVFAAPILTYLIYRLAVAFIINN